MFKNIYSNNWLHVDYKMFFLHFQVQIKNDPARTFALKQLKKHHIVETRQQEHIMNEKRIMIDSRCEFITK